MKTIRIVCVVVICCLSCRERYDPPVISANKTFLVVEANMDPGPRSTSVLLTRTSGLETRTRVTVENNAQVVVEGKDNTVRILTGVGRGYYRSANLNLTIGNEYRLRILTRDGKEYLSDYVKAKKSPPIDSIGWDKEKDGLRIHANTKDPSGASKYYRWDYDETWEIHSWAFSSYIYDNGSVRPRVFPVEEVYTCWKYDTSSTILLANSTRLQSDIIHKAPLTFIPNGSEKLAIRYSIQVRQYVLDRDAYNFFELIKRNTEEIGSLFSPQPSEIRGNIKCISDGEEYVLGYATCTTVEQVRAFIQIPWLFRYNCEPIKVPNIPDSIRFYFGSGAYLPYTFDDPPPVYSASTPNCIDCRVRGGNTIRPLFW